MKYSALVLALLVMIGCGQDSASYSSELSKEVPKPRVEGPDFGAYKPNANTPGSQQRAGR